jgi:hypothetical protein
MWDTFGKIDGNVEPFRVALEMLNGIPGVS